MNVNHLERNDILISADLKSFQLKYMLVYIELVNLDHEAKINQSLSPLKFRIHKFIQFFFLTHVCKYETIYKLRSLS